MASGSGPGRRQQLRRQRLPQPALELVGRPPTLADEQEPDVRMVERPEDVRRPVDVEATAEPSSARSASTIARWFS